MPPPHLQSQAGPGALLPFLKAGGEPWPSLSPAAWPLAQWSAAHGAWQSTGRLLSSLAVQPHSK